MNQPQAALLCALLAFAAPLAAQEVRKSASLAFPVLAVGQGARAAALGESYVALADDATAVYWNPAGLTQLTQQQATFSHHTYLQDSRFETMNYAHPLGRRSGIGASFGFLDYGEFEQRDGEGDPLGSFRPNDFGLGLAFGTPLGRQWSFGAKASWWRQTLLDSSHSALTWDLGFMGQPNGRLQMGLGLRNLGVDSAGGRLPVDLKVGVAYRVQVGEEGEHGLVYAGGADIQPDSVSRANLGFEYEYRKTFSGRVGSVIDFGSDPQDWKKGLSVGAGARFEAIQLDYAFTFGGDLGDSHRISLTGRWGARAGKIVGELQPTPTTVVAPPARPVTLTFVLPAQACTGPSDCFDQAVALEKKGLYMEAMKFYLKAAEFDARLEAVWLRLGRLYYTLGRNAFEKALEANPNNQALRQWLQLQP